MAKSMIERLKEERERMMNKGKSNDGINWFKMPKTDDAEVKVRILPAKNYFNDKGKVNDEPNLFYKKFGVHWINGKKTVCPKHTHGEACPICETVNNLYNNGSEEDIATAKQFKVQKRHLVNLVTVNSDGSYSEDVHVYEFGPKILDNILGWCVDEDYYDITDPKEGYDYRIIKKKKDGFPNYDESKPVKNASAIPDAQLKTWLETSLDVHEFVDKQVKTYEEIKAAFNLDETVDEPAEEVDEDELLQRINRSLKSDDE